MWTSPRIEIDFNILQRTLVGNKRPNHHRSLIFDIISAGDGESDIAAADPYKTK